MVVTASDPEAALNVPLRTVTILGSTGSVGRNTVDLVSRHPTRFAVKALTARRNAAMLAQQARILGAELAVVADASAYPSLKDALAGTGIAAAAGPEALLDAASRRADYVMAAIVGASGLRPTLAAVRRGAIIAFANKECLVCAGRLMMEQVGRHGATLLPVDSEHNAIFQVLAGHDAGSASRLILTASGGPFRRWDRQAMASVTPEQAVAHPTWSMGAKISVDSATMMNKGLEVVEAAHLFGMPSDRIDVLIHPQSVVHSMVEYVDGSVLAQLGTPDMRTPIAYTLSWPRRMETPAARLDLAATGTLEFEPPDMDRFPALRLARQALAEGDRATAVLNAANEIAVEAFLRRRIGFLDIERVVEAVLGRCSGSPVRSLEDIFDCDEEARHQAEYYITQCLRG